MKELNANDLDQVAGGMRGKFTQMCRCKNKNCENYGKMFSAEKSMICPKCGEMGNLVPMA